MTPTFDLQPQWVIYGLQMVTYELLQATNASKQAINAPTGDQPF